MLLRFDIAQNTPVRLGRPTDSRHFVKRLEATSLDGLVHKAAQAIVEKTTPAVLASYLYQVQEWEKLDNLLDQLVESSKEKIKVRALALRGVRLVDQCQLDEALGYFKAAVDVNPQSRFAMVKYGDALSKAGRRKEAIQIFEKADKIHNRAPSVLLYGSWARALAVSENVAKVTCPTTTCPKPRQSLLRQIVRQRNAAAGIRVFIAFGAISYVMPRNTSKQRKSTE